MNQKIKNKMHLKIQKLLPTQKIRVIMKVLKMTKNQEKT